jgi:hypothetical protein
MEKFYSVTRKSFDDLEVKTELELWNKVKGEYKGLSCEFPVTFEKTIVKNEIKKLADLKETKYKQFKLGSLETLNIQGFEI